jgi:hypothetical protein
MFTYSFIFNIYYIHYQCSNNLYNYFLLYVFSYSYHYTHFPRCIHCAQVTYHAPAHKKLRGPCPQQKNTHLPTPHPKNPVPENQAPFPPSPFIPPRSLTVRSESTSEGIAQANTAQTAQARRPERQGGRHSLPGRFFAAGAPLPVSS